MPKALALSETIVPRIVDWLCQPRTPIEPSKTGTGGPRNDKERVYRLEHGRMLISLFKYRHGTRVYQISAPLSRHHAATSTTPSVPPPIKDFSPRQKAVPLAKSKFCFRRIPRTLPIFPHCISGSLFLFPHLQSPVVRPVNCDRAEDTAGGLISPDATPNFFWNFPSTASVWIKRDGSASTRGSVLQVN